MAGDVGDVADGPARPVTPSASTAATVRRKLVVVGRALVDGDVEARAWPAPRAMARPMPRLDAGDQGRRRSSCRALLCRSSRAMMVRWIWLVPS